jgi:hypothetical protein
MTALPTTETELAPPTGLVARARGWVAWWPLTRQQSLWLLWASVVAYLAYRYGVPRSRVQVFLIIGLGLIAATSGNQRAWARVVRDWFPLFAILWAYDLLRAEVYGLSSVHVFAGIHLDKAIFGNIPTLWLQHALWTPGKAHWWDYIVFLVYLSHFFVSIIVAAVLWKFAPQRFHRFAFLFVGLTFAAFVTYAVFPAAPPWLASQNPHALGPTAKIIDEMWVHVGIHGGASVLSSTSNLANPVAAWPSLHGAYPFLLMLFFWKSAGRWRWLLPLYPLAMGFTLVYSAEHYVIDILLGWLYALVVYVVLCRVADYVARRRALGLGWWGRGLTPEAATT